eukprot:6182599-Pleurochrysis_carterae.AAC.1
MLRMRPSGRHRRSCGLARSSSRMESRREEYWRYANLICAQQWQCPCLDQRCLDDDRIKTLQLYDHRKRFQE